MKNKIKTILDKIEQKLDKHDTFVMYITILLAMCLVGMFAYWAYLAFTINLIFGILTIIIELGLLTWFND